MGLPYIPVPLEEAHFRKTTGLAIKTYRTDLAVSNNVVSLIAPFSGTFMYNVS